MRVNVIALGHRIQVLRKKRGYSQNALSEMIDKSPTYLSYIESGIKCMSLDTFVNLVNALNSTADELLIDSLENTIVCTDSVFASIIADCTAYEQRILLEIVIAAKESLRTNKKYFPRSR